MIRDRARTNRTMTGLRNTIGEYQKCQVGSCLLCPGTLSQAKAFPPSFLPIYSCDLPLIKTSYQHLPSP